MSSYSVESYANRCKHRNKIMLLYAYYFHLIFTPYILLHAYDFHTTFAHIGACSIRAELLPHTHNSHIDSDSYAPTILLLGKPVVFLIRIFWSTSCGSARAIQEGCTPRRYEVYA